MMVNLSQIKLFSLFISKQNKELGTLYVFLRTYKAKRLVLLCCDSEVRL